MDLLVIPLLAVVAWFGIQNATTTDRVILLPDASGRVGSVVVKTARGEQLIDTAYSHARVSGLGRIEVNQDEASLVSANYASTLATLPPRPTSFTVYFVSDSDTELTADSVPILAQMQAALASRPVPEISVIGHTDRVGRIEDNDALSIRRAVNVRSILARFGVADGLIEVAGRGEREPLVQTPDEVAEEKNRRVEISLR